MSTIIRIAQGWNRSCTGLIAALLALWSLSAGAAELRFSRSFGDHMVLQRDKPVLIRGFANPATEVTVTFAGQTKKVAADAKGEWAVTLDALPASSEGRRLTATSSGATTELKDVVVGDVILFARQTSIDISLGLDEAGRQAATALGGNPLLRAIVIKTIPAMDPQADLSQEATTGWAVAGKDQALKMSAAAFHLGAKLVNEAKAPVGIIDLNMGPGFAIGWLSAEALAGSDNYFGEKTDVQMYATWMAADALKFEEARKAGQATEQAMHPKDSPLYPASGYNATLHPLRGTALKAILLQLGNDYPYLAYERLVREGRIHDRAALNGVWWEGYMDLKNGFRGAPQVLPRVPHQWRSGFGDLTLPLALILPPSSHLATYAMHNVQIRELQRKTASAGTGIGLIMPGNENIPFSGQPADESLLAGRSLNWVLGAAYGKAGIPPYGPLFERVVPNYSKAQIFFKAGTADGLTAAPGALDQFEVAGIGTEFAPAKAVIDGTTIRLSSDTIRQIAYVRYNWRENPDQGLLNGAGLPAIPFRTDPNEFVEFPRTSEDNLPMEYTTPANEWKPRDVAIVSGSGEAYPEGDGYLGVTGLKVRPFGPNMRVALVLPGSPSDGKILRDDLIYSVDGKPLGDSHLHTVAAAIAHAESEAGGGRIVFGVHRGNTNLDVMLQLEVLGTYSATTPYDCPKAERIVANMEAYLAERGGLASDFAEGGWLNSDSLFLLAAGTPKYQGLVRRFVYKKMAGIDLSKPVDAAGGTWGFAHSSLFFAEYYLATGDRNVLPYLKWYADKLAASQIKEDTFANPLPRSTGGWRHKYPGGQNYGMMPPIGLPAMIGFVLAKEAGVPIDQAAYGRGMHLFRNGQAEMGRCDYSASMPDHQAPDPLEPEAVAKGMLNAYNGSRGMSAVLFHLIGDTRVAHLNSTYCVYAFNNCENGHGSNFFNGMWTPLGANMHSKTAFISFMRNHTWYQDLKRMYNHGYIACSRNNISMGHGLAWVVPRQRLRILGAPESVFAANPKVLFQPALAAFAGRDYERCETLATALLAAGELGGEDRTKINQLIRVARELQQSIDLDLKTIEGLIGEGKYYEAGLDLPQLKGVLPPGNARLAVIEGKLNAPGAQKLVSRDKARYTALQESLAFEIKAPKPGLADQDELWSCLTTEVDPEGKRRGQEKGRTTEREATQWRVKIVEALSKAPQGWMEPGFDDGGWGLATLPLSWHINHTFLARADFEVADKTKITALRVSAFTYRQQDIQVYVNGQLAAMINNCGAAIGRVNAALPESVLSRLRNGRNTIAVTTRNTWRWSGRKDVNNDGFGFRLDAILKANP
jgi:sialate O-acetylesterase